MALLPDYWWPTDSGVTIAQESSQLYRRKGSYSVHVTALNGATAGDPVADPVVLPTIGSGIVSSPFSIRPTEHRPFFTVQISLWVVAGAVRLELWDIHDCAEGDIPIWPPRESTPRAVTTELGNWVDNLAIAPGEDFYRGPPGSNRSSLMQIAIVADVDNSEWYLDAAMLTNLVSGVETFYEGRGSNELILAANEELLLKGSPLSKYDLSALDLTRLDPTTYPDEDIAIGGPARIRVAGFDDLNLQRRLLDVDKNLFEETDTKIEVETELGYMTRTMAKTNRRPRAIQQGLPEESSRPESIASATGSWASGDLIVRVAPTSGASYYEVREQGEGTTAVERYDNGFKLGPRTDSTQITITDTQDRDYDLTVRSYNRTGVASKEPYEFTAENLGAINRPFMPSDINLRLYWSFDERYDQNGAALIPQSWSDAGNPPSQFGDAELRRRAIYDQSQEDNHGRLCTYASYSGWPTGTPAPEKNKPGVSNAAAVFGDKATAAERYSNFYADSYACTVGSESPYGDGGDVSGLDMRDDFTLIAWMNPCLLWARTYTAEAFNWAHQHAIMSRMGQISWDYSPLPAGVNWATRGWFWYLGGTPKDWSNSWSPDLTPQYGAVPGIGFYYLPTLNPNGDEDDEDFALGNRHALFWPWEYAGPFDNNNDGTGSPEDEGEYCGWQFFALRVGAEDTGDPDWPLGASQFNMYAGWADGRKLYNLGAQIAPSLRSNMYVSNTASTAGAFHVDGEDVMFAVNSNAVNRRLGLSGHGAGDMWYDDSIWGDSGYINKFDEMRVYDRALSESEIAALYAHPGGQKRTENLLEPERQVSQP
jgi:hypothetical protein